MASESPFNPYAPPASPIQGFTERPADAAASPGERFGATLTDLVLYAGALTLGGMLGVSAEGAARTVLWWLPGALLSAANLWLLHRGGQTVGKWIRGIAVVQTNGARAALWRILLLRFAVPHLAFLAPAFAGLHLVGLLLFVADALCVYGSSGRCLHDRLAGTRVMAL